VAEENPETPKKNDVESILEVARRRFKLAQEAENEIREKALDDLRFRAGEQWPESLRAEREDEGQPCLTINRLPQYVKQITNEIRQNRPAIKVIPADDNADVETAKIFQGIIRHIENASNAEVAYDTAAEGAATNSFGYFRVVTEYCDPTSFDLEPKIKRVRNHFSVYLDPAHQEPDGSDANWGFVFEDISKEDYKSTYPKSKLASMSDWESLGNSVPGWAGSKTCRVAEYYYKTFRAATICLLNTGEKVEKKDLPEFLPPEIQIINERDTAIPTIKHLKINGIEILEETEWPGQWIPIIPVIGDELYIDGQRILESVIRHAKDPQKMYNYWASVETEQIALAPKAPFIGVEGQFEGHKEKWAQANRKNFAFLEYKATSIAGEPVPPPSRNVYEPPVQAITNARIQASEDLKSTTGIYDASLGVRSNETSGRAILNRAQQAETNNFHFVDNLKRSIRHCGRILIDLIPKIYDTPRAVRILGEDDSADIVRVNEIFEEKGEQKLYELGKGKYDVIVTTGPSFATKRQEAAKTMLEFTRDMPQVAPMISDLIVKNMDWPGAQEIAERLKKTLPPGIAEDKDKKPLPPEVQTQMAQMNQMIEALTQQLNEASELVKTKKMELESRERIEMAKIQANLEIESAKLGSTESIELLRQQIAQIQARQERFLDFYKPINENETDPDGNSQVSPSGDPSQQSLEMGIGAQDAFVPEDQPPTGGLPPG